MIDLVVVVFKPEIDLLKIQAKSIEQYFPDSLLNQILVTVNDDIEVLDLIDLSWWGKYKQKVKLFHKYDFSNHADKNIGWESQQLFKILTSKNSQSPITCVLDAKTWFIKPVIREYFFNDKNKVNVALMPLFDGFKNSTSFLNEMFGIDYRHIIGPGGVPFFFHSDTLRDMINFIGDPFDIFFCTNVKCPHEITEFTLYSAFVLAQNKFYDIYSGKQTYNVINIAHFEIDLFDDLLKKMQHPLVLTASIHLSLYNKINDQQFLDWCNFLVDKKLFSELEIAQNQLNNLRSGVDNGTRV